MIDNWLVPLSLGVGALLALAILWKVPQWQVGRVRRLDAKERFDRVNEARKTLATILGGAAFLVGGFFTLQNLKVAQENLEVSREGQITDRFTKAIEQLGAVNEKGEKKLEVRLGGIYALERIANESERDHWPIMEVLCTYVRVNAPAPSKGEGPLSEAQKPKVQRQKNQSSTPLPHPTADIQAILTVLGRRDRTYERTDELNLRNTDIRGADLQEADFSKTDFSKADLREADFRNADLRRADLFWANLSRANLGGANLSHAILLGADLSGAKLAATRLSGAHLDGAQLSKAILAVANLDGANLSGANLSGTNLEGANLSGALLWGAHLRGAKGLTEEQVVAAKGSSATKLPEGLHMPEGWKK